MERLCISIIFWFFFPVMCSRAQEKPSVEGKALSAATQPGQRDPRFEVASIRRVELTGFPYGGARSNPHFDAGLYRYEQIGLIGWVQIAFELKQHGYNLEAPHWMDTETFTINAVPAEGTSVADVPNMLRHLLEDRFGLKYHFETRQVAGYQLVVAKSGSRLTQSPVAERKLIKRLPEVKNGLPQFAKDSGSGFILYRNTALWRGRDETLEELASGLRGRVGAPVEDATGLKGKYDYDLTFTFEMPSAGGGAVVAMAPQGINPDSGGGGATASVPLEHPFLRDALREQLGLELKPVKNVPVTVLVIDGANKEPTEN